MEIDEETNKEKKLIGSKCFREGMRTRQALGRAGPYSYKIECVYFSACMGGCVSVWVCFGVGE
jgi:hypothetical protein